MQNSTQTSFSGFDNILFFNPNNDKFNIIDRQKLELDTACSLHDCLDWQQFNSSLFTETTLVVFHKNLVKTMSTTISHICIMLRTLAKSNDKTDEIKMLMVSDEPLTKKETGEVREISELWTTNNSLLEPALKNMTDKKSVEVYSMKMAPALKEYDSTMLYLRDEISPSILPKMANYLETNTGHRVKFSTEFSELCSNIDNTTKSILLHIDVITRSEISIPESMLMLRTLLKFNGVEDCNIGVSITRDTDMKTIKILQRNNVTAIIPSVLSWGTEEAIVAAKHLTTGVRYYPKHILQTLNSELSKKKEADTSTQLTNRQREVFDLIAKRGLSNKQIARTLNISESTVKIHVSSIFKTLCVRNRTQLALTKI